MILRDATEADAARIGDVHYRARAEAYPAFLPPDRVNWRSLAERQQQWLEFLRDPGCGRDRCLVVLDRDAEGIVGFAAGGPQRHGDPDFPGEVWSIYVLRAFQGRGHGRSLMSEVARRLAPGFPGLIVWTQAPNARARGFYERLGGRYVRTRPVNGIDIVGYGWRDIRTLVAE